MNTLTGGLRGAIDRLWLEFFTGGITNPLTVIEQITYLMYARMLDERERRAERVEQRTGKKQKKLYASTQQHLRWSSIRRLGQAEQVVEAFTESFKHMKTSGDEGTLQKHLVDAQMLIQKPTLLVKAMEIIDGLPLDRADLKGDLYEYLLSKLQTAGINGQFRTPRHVIEFMVRLAAPRTLDVVGDPACGTAGFLAAVASYTLEQNTSEAGTIREGEGADAHVYHSGDKLTADEREHLQGTMLHGFDFDSTMLRLAAMNLSLHGVDAPRIHYQDSLARSFTTRFERESANFFDVILANPPFTGSLDKQTVHPTLTNVVSTRKTELLFLALILRMLKVGGRSATIVPDGVLFGSSNAPKGLRTLLVEHHQLEAVISLPSGVFKPYAGVSTAILFFTKGGKTDHVFYYDVDNDGYSLDDRRTPIAGEQLSDALARFKARDPKKDTDRTARWFTVPKGEIAEKGYDLSINRYRETKHVEVHHEHPRVILGKLRAIEAEIAQGLDELDRMLASDTRP